jgi:hypothetical protein
MNLKQTIRRILREEDYSPAGKEIIPNNIVIHKSNPMFRDKIMENGLKVRAGECYKIYVGYGTKCRPAIFATNSTNKRAWFDSTYDDDIWEINTEMIPDVKWYKDRHFESRSKHIVTFQDIPKEAITLKYEGTGSGDVKKWNKDSPNIIEQRIRRILREETKIPPSLMRRLNDIFPLFIKSTYKWLNPKSFQNFEEFINRVIFSANRDFVSEYGKHSDVDSYDNLCQSFKKIAKDFIMEYYYDEIYNYYKKEISK